ncbi:MAG TPA: GH25 family lysozyme [Ferruginibacter sp.]|nr:glycoside hydrolase family 25 protein [Chitinophagaceae bacterium]MBK7558246.1 glycoside hydrolase family 25 protein [Chitinophagaceae bacterium]MBK9531949.1 glycoside hydrolase family 25 protein [Chitinophagaceae bacterium]HQW92298.1 GH25 family lysozyme [Ferruginibacter sp.]
MAKRKKSIFRSIFIPVILLAGIAAAVYYINAYLSRPAFVRYPAFGIDLPVNYPIHGIDVSRYQHNIDWKAVKAMEDKNIKIGFAFIKATEGLGRVDIGFRKNWFNAKKALMPRGAYHFFISSKSGKAQAENFIETVNLDKGDLPPVLDIESTNGASVTDIQQRAKDWLQVIEKHYKVKPIIYTNIDFYSNFLDGHFDDYPLWVAHYYVKDKPRIDRNWIMWQHNEKGRVNGIDSFVDFNVFNGDSAAFKKLLTK